MKKRIAVLFVLLTVVVLSYTGYQVQATKAEQNRAAYEAYRDELVKQRLKHAYQDGLTAFQINQEEYNYYNLMYTDPIPNMTEEEFGQLHYQVDMEVLSSGTMQSGDLYPGLFLKKGTHWEGLLVYKGVDGSNHLARIEKKPELIEWTLYPFQTKAGQVSPELEALTFEQYLTQLEEK